MKIIPFLTLAILVGLEATVSTTDDEKVIMTQEFFNDTFNIYTAQHEIVSLTVPLNALNIEDDNVNDNKTEFDPKIILFFAEADIDADGKKDYKGLYVFKEGKATKLLEHGTDAAAAYDDTKVVYFGAKDGLYVYNPVENKAEKYGTVTDSIIGIVKENGTDVIYILTEDHNLYKVTDNGNKKTKMDDVKGAQQIVMDFSNNLFYYDADKQPFVVTADGVKKIEGLPANPTYVSLMKPFCVVHEGVFFVSDQKTYSIDVDGSSHLLGFELQVKPTAYAGEATFIQYYAYNKKIYEYNILALLRGEGDYLDDLKKFLEDKMDWVQSIATSFRRKVTT